MACKFLDLVCAVGYYLCIPGSVARYNFRSGVRVSEVIGCDLLVSWSGWSDDLPGSLSQHDASSGLPTGASRHPSVFDGSLPLHKCRKRDNPTHAEVEPRFVAKRLAKRVHIHMVPL